MKQRLYRSEDNKIIAGILGGLGEYLDIDPTILRLFFVAVTVFTGIIPGALIYLVALIIVPRRPHGGALQHTVIEAGGKTGE